MTLWYWLFKQNTYGTYPDKSKSLTLWKAVQVICDMYEWLTSTKLVYIFVIALAPVFLFHLNQDWKLKSGHEVYCMIFWFLE